MRGRIPTYYVGKRTHLPRTRILIQEQEPLPTEVIKRLGYKHPYGWITNGGYHIMCYGMSKRQVFERIWKILEQVEEQKKKKGLFSFLHR